jgi:cellulose biosynthesis protein BcsQ
MKTIIAIYNSGGKGKSTTTLELANLLLAIPGCRIIYSDKPSANLTIDFRLIIEINGKIIALESQGDPGTHLQKRLDDIVKKHNPYLIFCTCRTRGETVAAVNIIAKVNSYDLIWSTTYETKHSHQLVNRVKAEHLQDLIIKMGLI